MENETQEKSAAYKKRRIRNRSKGNGLGAAMRSEGFKLEIVNPDASLTEVSSVKSFSAGDGSSSEISTTHLQSVASEFIIGLPDNGSFTGSMNYISNDPGQVLMRDARVASETLDFVATFSDGSTMYFTAYVSAFPIAGAVQSVVEVSFSLRITGEITYG